MKNKPAQLNIQYLGIKNPNTPAEVEFEILGLESVIAEAKHRISQLRQAIALVNLVTEEKENDHRISETEKEGGSR